MWLLLALILLASRDLRAEDVPEFYRAINLGGPALMIDGRQWEAGDAAGVVCDANAFDNQSVPLTPLTDDVRAQMIRSSRWGRDMSVELHDVPAGIYQVCLYVWEDNAAERFYVQLNDKSVVLDHDSGTAGKWKRLGPWRTIVRSGTIRIKAGGGAANLSGLEIWKGDGPVPDPLEAAFESAPSEEQLAFFESRIRPLLIDHCYACHSADAEEPGGGLLLDSRAGLVKGGLTEPPIVPGDPASSLLLKAVRHLDPDLKMPPEEKLADDQIADLETWIRMKAPDPRSENTVAVAQAKTAIDWNKARDFWSLHPIARPAIPTVADSNWPANELDSFILQKLETAELKPAPDADKRTLIRRATFDLIGLPPTPEEVDAFLADGSPEAFANVVDRLLASPQYGERWGRHWLDVVRYSDTAGDNSDFPIPQMHLYRNWVIDAFNRDLPFDQFVTEQLAGDLLPGDSEEERRERLIATGYIANARRFGSRVDDYPQHLTIEDTIDNLGRTFLATTINCARCHNHKFDPIPTEDYYALYGILHSTRYPWPGIELDQRQRDLVTLASVADVERIATERATKQKELDDRFNELKKERDQSDGENRDELEKKVKEAEDAAKSWRSQRLPYETLYAVAEADVIEDMAVQIKGDPAKPGSIVPRRFLSMLSGREVPPDDATSGRLQLAGWITDSANPLTARVLVNRIWVQHFGKGLVATPNDFGRQGRSPSHPELLDWLAQRFIDDGWSIKSMHRTILLSRTWRQSSQVSSAAIESDPVNELLSAYPRRRLDAEAIRDSLLILGGNLDASRGGEHPFPPSHEWKFTQHNPFKAVYESNRRSVYLMTQRIQRHPYLAIFDGADPSVSTPLRQSSTTPLQALYLLNDKFVHDQAVGLSARLIAEFPDNAQRVDRAWQLLFARLPDGDERVDTLEFLDRLGSELKSSGVAVGDVERTRWQSVVRSLFRANEFVYVD